MESNLDFIGFVSSLEVFVGESEWGLAVKLWCSQLDKAKIDGSLQACGYDVFQIACNQSKKLWVENSAHIKSRRTKIKIEMIFLRIKVCLNELNEFCYILNTTLKISLCFWFGNSLN